MKKRIISILIVLVIALSFLTGCGIIVKNKERDMAQIVLEVGYQDESAHADFVRRRQFSKGELKTNIYTIGSQYLQQGMAIKEVVPLIVDYMVDTEMMVQTAVIYFANKNSTVRTVEACLTKEEIWSIKWDVYNQDVKEIKGIEIDIKKEQNLISEEEWADAKEEMPENRATQTPVVDEREIKKDVKEFPSDKDIEKEFDSKTWRGAVKRFQRLIDQGESGLTYEESVARRVNTLLEAKLLDNYIYELEGAAIGEWKKNGQYAQVKAKYETALSEQKAKYTNNKSKFVDDIKADTGSAFILYSPISFTEPSDTVVGQGYFRVKNLLVGFTPKEEALLSLINATDATKEWKKEERNKLLSSIKAEDKRNIWTYAEDTNEKIGYNKTKIEFPKFLENQTAKVANEDGTETDNPNKMTSLEITSNDTNVFTTHLKSEITRLNGLTGEAKTDYDKFYNHGKTYVENAMASLIFKYGTDPGMFNNAVDYLIPFNKDEDTMVEEFADTSRAAAKVYLQTLASGTKEAAQLASIKVTFSDFGWHIIMVTEVIGEGNQYAFPATEAEYNAQVALAGTFAYRFTKSIENDIKGNVYRDEKLAISNKYKDVENYTKKYESRYKDLTK